MKSLLKKVQQSNLMQHLPLFLQLYHNVPAKRTHALSHHIFALMSSDRSLSLNSAISLAQQSCSAEDLNLQKFNNTLQMSDLSSHSNSVRQHKTSQFGSSSPLLTAKLKRSRREEFIHDLQALSTKAFTLRSKRI
ncbi:hypothetical protein P9112_008922 [Eukaryota sp. TZLM1-RC]